MSSMESVDTYLYLTNHIRAGDCSSQRLNLMAVLSQPISVNERRTISCSSSLMARRCYFTLQQTSEPKHAITSYRARRKSADRTLSQMREMPHAKRSLLSGTKNEQGCAPVITAGFTTVQVSYPFTRKHRVYRAAQAFASSLATDACAMRKVGV